MELTVETNRVEGTVKLLLQKRDPRGVIAYGQDKGIMVAHLFRETPYFDKVLPFLEMNEDLFKEFLESVIVFSARYEKELLAKALSKPPLL
jgi:hypothetical protein